jgi:hypothetical protein
MAAPTREDTWLVTVKVGDNPLGVFDQFSGGEVDSEEARYSPGGMVAEISLGGRRTIGNVTVSRYCDRELDWPNIKWLTGQVGIARCTIGYTPMTASGVVAAGTATLTYEGTLKTVTPPEHDSTGNDAAQLELEITCDKVG